MREITDMTSLRALGREWRAAGQRIALVPTMGALHAGHLRLIGEGQKRADRVVVSIFVNPAQFGPAEDFAHYPRPLERDLELLRHAEIDAAWLPSVEEMYPPGFGTQVQVAGVSEDLCGAARPGHFDGVATVVAKLLLQVGPDLALFGEKDYQQLCIVRQLVRDLNIPVEILGVPTVREADGLARSSRNQYLSERERRIAPELHAVLSEAANQVKTQPVEKILAEAKARLLAAGFASVEYLELRAEEGLRPLTSYQPPARLLIAARLGTTRLIDNLPVT